MRSVAPCRKEQIAGRLEWGIQSLLHPGLITSHLNLGELLPTGGWMEVCLLLSLTSYPYDTFIALKCRDRWVNSVFNSYSVEAPDLACNLQIVRKMNFDNQQLICLFGMFIIRKWRNDLQLPFPIHQFLLLTEGLRLAEMIWGQVCWRTSMGTTVVGRSIDCIFTSISAFPGKLVMSSCWCSLASPRTQQDNSSLQQLSCPNTGDAYSHL